MSRNTRDSMLFVGRLSKNTRTRDLEDIFESYGRMTRCEIKYGAEMAYAFVDYEDRRDAEDALKYENGRDVCGSSIIVEWAKGSPRRPLGYDECYKCHRVGHWARDCPDDRHYGFRRPKSKRSRSRSKGRRSRSPRRRRSRSRSRGKRSRRSYSRSRSRSTSRDHRRKRKTRSKSRGSRSPSRSPVRYSRSRSRSGSKNGDQRENGNRGMQILDEVDDN